jgi:hypothetical protein
MRSKRARLIYQHREIDNHDGEHGGFEHFTSSNRLINHRLVWVRVIDSSKRAINLAPFFVSKSFGAVGSRAFRFHPASKDFSFYQNLLCAVMSSAKTIKRSKKRSNTSSNLSGDNIEVETNCDECFTLSGSNPPKTVGPLSRRHDQFAKYAPCGHCSTCNKNGCEKKKYFEACNTCPGKGEKFSFAFEAEFTFL